MQIAHGGDEDDARLLGSPGAQCGGVVQNLHGVKDCVNRVENCVPRLEKFLT